MTPKAEAEVLDVEARRAALLTELADLPPAEAPNKQPGEIVGTGFAADKVEYTAKWFIDNYPLHEVIANETIPIRVNGVGFMVYKGIACKLPEPHYAVYKNYIDNARREEERWAPPVNPPNTPGYVTPVHRMGIGFLNKAEEPES